MGRIDNLLAAMTLEEKIGQLTMVAASRAVTGPAKLTRLDGAHPRRARRRVAEPLGRG